MFTSYTRATRQFASAALGVNNLNQVAGWSDFDDSGTMRHRAFLWLPEADLNLPAGMNNLGVLGGAAPASEAREINDAGNVVGWSTHSDVDKRAFLWLHASGLYDSLGQGLNDITAAVGGSERSEAWDVTETTDPLQIVGTRFDFPTRGFLFQASAIDEPVVLQLPPLGTDDCGYEAFSINPNAPTAAQTFVAGMGSEFDCAAPTGCGVIEDFLAIAWENLDPDDLAATFTDRAQARGAIDGGSYVGSSDEFVDPSCQVRAMYWETSTSSPVNLHPGLAADESFAESIRNDGQEIVGGALDAPFGESAVRWQRDGSSWSFHDLNTEISSRCPSELLVAYDVNDIGSIVCVADIEPGAGVRRQAVLLTLTSLEPCPEDVNKDGVVNETDLALVQTSEGCPFGSICWEDVNFDCFVDDGDVKAVMAKMHTNCGQSSSSTQMSDDMIDLWLASGGYDGLNDGSITADEVGDALEAPTAADEFAALMALID